MSCFDLWAGSFRDQVVQSEEAPRTSSFQSHLLRGKLDFVFGSASRMLLLSCHSQDIRTRRECIIHISYYVLKDLSSVSYAGCRVVQCARDLGGNRIFEYCVISCFVRLRKGNTKV